MDYKIMESPFEINSFEEMNKKQAEQYFNWFMETKEERIQNLQDYIKQETSEVILDKTPESLIGLWKWFEPKIQMERNTDEEIQEELEKRPDWMREHILENPFKFTILTIALAFDISVYLGEVIIKNNPQIYWGYLMKPKRLMGVKRPILLGFKGDVNAFCYNLVEVCIWRSIDCQNENELYETYQIWCGNV